MIRWSFTLPAEPQRIQVLVTHQWVPIDPDEPRYSDGHWLMVRSKWCEIGGYMSVNRFVTQEFIDRVQPAKYPMIHADVSNGYTVIVSVCVSAAVRMSSPKLFRVEVKDKLGLTKWVPRNDFDREPLKL